MRHPIQVPTSTEPRGRMPQVALERGQPLWVQEADAGRTAYRYDAAGRLIERRDAGGNATRYVYDEAGRLIQVMHPDGACLQLAYDAAGRLCQRILPNGDTCTFRYSDGRVEAVAFNAGDTTGFIYDASGRLATVAESGCVTTYCYAPQGRLHRVERTIDQRPYGFDYNAAGQLIALHFPNHTTIELATLPTPPVTPTMPDAPQRDAHGNVIAWAGSTFSYDGHDQLIEAHHPQYGCTRYQYDPVGNRTVRLRPDGATSYTYDSRHQLTHMTHPDGSVTSLVYDANGRLIRKAHGGTTWRYAYNGRQQLVSIHCNGQVVARYRYDFQGRRIGRQVGGALTLYHYDEMHRLRALTHADGAPSVVFTYDSGQTVVHCFQAQGDVHTYRLHTDHLGSTRRITDAASQVIWQGEYTPFGQLRGAPPAFPCPLFVGQLWDPESGFYYCQSRYYDPQVGRFITPDAWTHGPDDARLVGQGETCVTPIFWLTQPGLAHPYVYSLNNPLTHRDPLGLSVGLTVLRTILAIFWSLPWTVFGFALGLVDALLQFVLLGALYLPRFALDRTSSSQIGSAALLKIGGLFNFQFAWANVVFIQRGDFDALDDTKQQYIIPVEAQRTPRQLRTEKQAYFDYLLRHTVLANYFGPIWPPVYLFGGFIPLRKNAVRESGYSPIDDPVLTVATEKDFFTHRQPPDRHRREETLHDGVAQCQRRHPPPFRALPRLQRSDL
jgi:RHS repeat-associated protein